MNEMRPFGSDPISIAGKFAPPEEHAEVVVIGAGPAGIAAALEAAQEGRRTVLVDEHPVSPGLMGLDVPYWFGGRMSAAVQSPDRMLERVIAANPAIEEAFDAGIDVRLGTSCWGAFVNGPGLAALPSPVVGLADAGRSWLCGFDRLVVAAGARDLGLFFAGCEAPGVLGARGLASLLATYDAFEGRRLVILGSGDLALKTALDALERGLEVAAIVEVAWAPRGSATEVERLAARGVPLLAGHAILRAESGLSGVEAAILRPLRGGEDVRIACDTICVAVGLVPNIELCDVLGLPRELRADLGGWVPAAGLPPAAHGRTDIAFVGDCAGLAEGRDALDYRLAWMRALLATGGSEVPACLCEEVSRADLLNVQPPRYLGERSPAMAARDLASLAATGPLDPDHVKRLTRAGMGACQGRRCREQVAMLLALGSGAPLSSTRLAGYRAPVRPLPLGVLAAFDEPEIVRRHWDVWFGIPQQWVPYADIGTEREAAASGRDMHL